MNTRIPSEFYEPSEEAVERFMHEWFGEAAQMGDDVTGPQPERHASGEGQQQGQMFGGDMFAGREVNLRPRRFSTAGTPTKVKKKPATKAGGWYDPDLQD